MKKLSSARKGSKKGKKNGVFKKWMLGAVLLLASIVGCIYYFHEETIQLNSQHLRFYRSEDNDWIAYGFDGERFHAYLSTTGRKFYEVWEAGYKSPTDAEQGELHFEDIRRGKKGTILLGKDTDILDDKTYNHTSSMLNITVVPLPSVRKPKYLFELPYGEMLVVSVDAYQPSRESIRMYLGQAKNLKPVQILAYEYSRANGIIKADTNKGMLVIPLDYQYGKPVWCGRQVQQLDLEKYRISESLEEMSVSPQSS